MTKKSNLLVFNVGKKFKPTEDVTGVRVRHSKAARRMLRKQGLRASSKTERALDAARDDRPAPAAAFVETAERELAAAQRANDEDDARMAIAASGGPFFRAGEGEEPVEVVGLAGFTPTTEDK